MKTPSKVGEQTSRPDALRFRNPDGDPRGPHFLADATMRGDRPGATFELNGMPPPPGRFWRYSLARLSQLENEGRLVFGPNGRPRVKRYLSEVRNRAAPNTDEEPVDSNQLAANHSVSFIVKRLMAELIRAVAFKPAQLAQVEWRDLERVLGHAFEGLGFDARVTRSARDGGFDIELTCSSDGRSRRFLVEVKHWMGSGKQPWYTIISDFFDVVAKEVDADRGLLLSTTGFSTVTAERRTCVERHKVALGDGNKVISICQEFVRCERGVFIPDPDTLPELLFAGTY